MVEDGMEEAILNSKIGQEMVILRFIDSELFYEDENPRGLAPYKMSNKRPEVAPARNLQPKLRPRDIPKNKF